MSCIKTVFHVHTDHSDDSNASVESIARQAQRRAVGCLAVTDHDTIDGALALSRIAPPGLQVIVGEEISTSEGHLIGLFLRECVQPGLPARRTAELIREQGGLVIAPHPFNTVFGCSLRDNLYALVDLLDAVEVCNAQNLLPRANRLSEAFASRFRLPRIVGADAHHRGHLDACYQWMRPFRDPQSFLESLRLAHFVKGRHTLGYFVRSASCVLRERLGIALPSGYGANCHQPHRHVPVRTPLGTGIPSPGL